MKTVDELKIFRKLFEEMYPYCFMNQIEDKVLSEYLSRDYVKNTPIWMQINLVYDWCLSQQMCDVQE